MTRIKLLFFLLAGLLASPGLLASGHEESPAGLLAIITSESNDTQAMALILTTHYARGGRDVRVLLCDHAGGLAVSDSDMGSTVVQPADRSPRQLLQGIIEAGAVVEVCAIFLPGAGLEEADLVGGVGVARPPEIAGLMASPDWRLFTF